MPWVSVGWHAHFWGSPVLDPAKVPSLYNPATGHFRQDINRAEDVVYEEILAEMRAQMDRCVKILGRAPDTGGFGRGDSPFSRAMTRIIEEYGIVHDFSWHRSFTDRTKVLAPDPKWADRNIHMMVARDAFAPLDSYDVREQEAYNPLAYYLEDKDQLLDMPEDRVIVTVWHPGYVDYYVAREGDQMPFARTNIASRTVDVHSLTHPLMKEWIKKNKVELMNFRDALYGTKTYQQHLKDIGSDLCMIP
jgi:predicted glycoside hydrolase/deacetylase ChbG (UPF0249 family)